MQDTQPIKVKSMIKTIIKRDGSKEPFTAKKINDWGRWAGDDSVDWSSVVMDTVALLPEEVTSTMLQEALINKCIEQQTWGYIMMAGRLYGPHLLKTTYPDGIPTIYELHQRLIDLKLMVDLNYTDEEYEYLNQHVIDHDRDYHTPHFSLKYIREKYSIQNRTTNTFYETQQFTYMRMAMAIASNEPRLTRLKSVEAYYQAFSNKLVSAPTPNFVNLGTPLRGFASCCLYTVGDTVNSIGAGDWIGYRMTASSAGIGNNYKVRSLGDPVRGGAIEHNGKLPYFKSMASSVKANMQAGRGGACTTYYSGFDPEAEVISQLRNPRATEDKRNRDLHYALMTNRFFANKVARNEEAFVFNPKTAPDLTAAFYSGDQDLFKELYERYEQDESFKKTYFSPRKLLVTVMNEAFETGVAYMAQMDEMNRHTPFNESIYSSNLCLEIAEPTSPYMFMKDLDSNGPIGYMDIKTSTSGYTRLDWNARVNVNDRISFAGRIKPGDEVLNIATDQIETVTEIVDFKPEPEIAMCSLAAINVAEVDTDEEYEEAMYVALKMIDYCILNSDYELTHVGYTAKARMNAGVGIMGLATLMARERLLYDTPEGKQRLHQVAERHMYMAIKASIRISQERGLAPWIHKTKWVDGWTPMQTYKKSVDELGDFKNVYDWDALSEEIRANGGIAHSCLVAYMPGESSSKALGQANSIYPIRETAMIKTDNKTTVDWIAPESDDPMYRYQPAWEIKDVDQIDFYAIFQKWTDQGISADMWVEVLGDERVGSTTLIKQYLRMIKYGMKSRYYLNTQTSNYEGLVASKNINDEAACAGGGCTI